MPNLGLDLQRNQINGVSINPGTYSASTDGSGVDFLEAEGPVTAVVQLGNLSNQVLTLVVTLEDSADDSTFAALDPASSVSLSASDENSVTLLTTFARSERYVRATTTHTGTALQNTIGVSLHSKSKSY